MYIYKLHNLFFRVFVCVFCGFILLLFFFLRQSTEILLDLKKLYPARELDIEMKVDNLGIDDNKIQYAGRSTWAVKE